MTNPGMVHVTCLLLAASVGRERDREFDLGYYHKPEYETQLRPSRNNSCKYPRPTRQGTGTYQGIMEHMSVNKARVTREHVNEAE